MGRWLHKSWQDKRPGWTRRIRWYNGITDIRLCTEDENGMMNHHFTNELSAVFHWDAFRAGKIDAFGKEV